MVVRVLPGRFSVDAVTAPEFERQLQVWAAAGSGPASARTAEEHQEVLRELRGDLASIGVTEAEIQSDGHSARRLVGGAVAWWEATAFQFLPRGIRAVSTQHGCRMRAGRIVP